MRSDLIPRPSPLRPRQQPSAHDPSAGGGVATAVDPLLVHFFGGPPPVRFEFWDGTFLGPAKGDTIVVRSPDAVQRLLWAPSELGLARAFVMGDLAFEGDIFAILAALHAASPGTHPRRVQAAHGRRCRRRVASASSAARSRHLPRRRRPGGDCTRAVATPRRCSTTTTSATTSTPWCSGLP